MTTLTSALALFGFGALATPVADACSPDEGFGIALDQLLDGDPEDLLRHLQPDYRTWAEETYELPLPDYVPTELPLVTGAWYQRAVIAVDPPDGSHASVGGVSIVDSIWGEASALPGTFELWIDTSSCAGAYPLAEPGTFHLLVEADSSYWVNLWHPRTDKAIAAGRQLFDSAFGAAQTPARDRAAEDAALTSVLNAASADDVDGEPLRFLDPFSENWYRTDHPQSEPGDDDGEPTESSGQEPGAAVSAPAADSITGDAATDVPDGGENTPGRSLHQWALFLMAGFAALAGIAIVVRHRPSVP